MSSPRFVRGLVLAIIAAVVFACGTAFAAKSPTYAPSLSVSWPLSATNALSSSSTPYLVSGCGYNSSYSGVTIVVHAPTAMAFAGQMPDSNGCISLSNFSTLGPGHYEIDAYQTTRNKASLVASTSFDL